MAPLELKPGVKLDLAKIPKWAQIVIIVVLVAGAGAAYYFLQYEPKSQQIDGLIATIQKQQNDINVKKAKAARLEELKKENEWLKARLKELTEQLPEESEVSGLLRQISDLGKSADLEILSWVPGRKRTNPSGLYEEIPVDVALNGTYHNLGAFFSKISLMTRIVNITGIRMSGKEKLGVGFTATAFTRVPAPAQGGGK